MKNLKKYPELIPEDPSLLNDFQESYDSPDTFVVQRGGKRTHYSVQSGYGYYLKSIKNTHSLIEIGALLDRNLTFSEITDIIDYLEMKMVDVAKSTSVSPSTVSRWTADSLIGTPGSYQFFKMDEAIKKGVEYFGNPSRLKSWLDSPNLAFGQARPADLMFSMIGIDLVHEGIDALHFGNVL
jgi:putative toxin-antitoxin system antitoxin component (TIGR02293 family)